MSATVDNMLLNSTSELAHADKGEQNTDKKELDMYSGNDEPSPHIDITDVHSTDICKSNDLSVHRILQSNHLMSTDDLVGSSTILLSDSAVINSSQSSVPGSLILTSVFTSAPIMTVGESSKDVSLGPKVCPSDILLPKSERDGSHDDIAIKESGSVLLASSSQATFLLPSYYDNDHLVHVSPNSVPLYQNTTGSSLYEPITQVHSCQWQNCTEHFLTVDDLVNHISTVHISGKESMEYSCKWKNCVRRGKGFNARYKMLIHMRTHTGEKPHKCTYPSCDKKFSRLENLKIHIRSHTGEKPYACHYEGCDKRYSNSSDRFKHTRTHIESKPYRCKVEGCFKQYTDPSSLRKHLKAHKLSGTALLNSQM